MLIKNIIVYRANRSAPSLKNIMLNAAGQLQILSVDHFPPQAEATVIDAQGKFSLLPGLLDAHVHGQGGVDFADADNETTDLSILTRALGKTGLSYAMATVVSLALPTLKKALAVIDDYVVAQNQNPKMGHTNIVGIHLEGPFIAKNCKGAHAESALQDHIDMPLFKEMIAAAPHIQQWKITLAPDLPGAQDFIRQVKSLEAEGIFVKIFLGHANPDDKQVIGLAIKNGAVGFTHLGNACQETCCRETRALAHADTSSHLVQWVLENPALCPPGIELIADGKHLSSSFMQLISQAVAEHEKIGDKIVLITDALGPAGMPDGLYQLGTLTIRKAENNFYIADAQGEFVLKMGVQNDGTQGLVRVLAGSAASLAFCAENYANAILNQDESVTEKMRVLHQALIVNPRLTSLSQAARQALPDENNFVIFNEAAKMVLSVCNGEMIMHTNDLLNDAKHENDEVQRYQIRL